LLNGAVPDLLAGWSPGRPPWLEAFLATPRDAHGPRLYTVMGGYALAGALATGRADYIPVRLSAMGRLLAQLRPSLAVVPGVRRGRGFALRGGIGWHLSAARHANGVVVEVDSTAPDIGLPEIPGHIVDVREIAIAADAYTPPEPGSAERKIARTVAAMLPDEPTLQFGPGAITSAILAAIDRPVRVASGLATTAIADLAERELLRGRAIATYDWGGPATRRLALEGNLTFVPIEESNDPGKIAAIDRFVALNTALQVDIEGSVNVERLDGRTVAGSGGHADFCAGASHSRGGLSVIALRSTGRGGVSTIVPRVEVVSTPRTDVDVIITEHGVADLRGCGNAERTGRIVRVAAPQHRDWLSRESRPTPGTERWIRM
jgi:acyl-CoA hydrolase